VAMGVSMKVFGGVSLMVRPKNLGIKKEPSKINSMAL
tara:strand:+ start:226 stop:336 length:111 start_codon:yes stop_codon:yes gene_type:complete